MQMTPRFCVFLLAAACAMSFGAGTARAQELTPSSAVSASAPFAITPAAPRLLAAAQEKARAEVRRFPRSLIVSLYAGLAATQALDVHSTLRAIDSGAQEANAMMRWATANPARFIGVKAATTTGTMLILERLRRTHPKPALFLLAGLSSASAVIAAHNYSSPARR